jgi:RepB DNA-primase from phage plasmid
MRESDDRTRHAAAQAMLHAFASVGASRFDVTWTDLAGVEQGFRRNVMTAYLARMMPTELDAAARRQRNVIVRPRSDGEVTFVQLDDLGADQLARVAPAVFLILETSPGNFQAWAALTETADPDFVRRLKKGAGADAGASGATRVAGSINFKAKYAPDFPRVAIRAVNAGRTTTIAELDRLGLVAPLARVLRRAVDPARRRSGAGCRQWPSYARCLDGAPLNGAETGPDTSRADFLWCMIAIDWGWALEEVATRLLTESAKAQAHGRGYAELTVRNAALAVERRGHA